MRFAPLLGPPAALGLLWIGALWLPSQSAMEAAEVRLEQSQVDQLALVAEIDALNEIAEILPELQADLTAVAEAVPADPDIDAFLSAVASEAEASGVRVTLISPSQILDSASADASRPVPSGMNAIAFVLEAEGSFDAVMAFTSRLDELRRLVVVDRIGMSAIDGDEQVIVVDMSLRIFSGGIAPQQADVTTTSTVSPDQGAVEEGGRTRDEENER